MPGTTKQTCCRSKRRAGGCPLRALLLWSKHRFIDIDAPPTARPPPPKFDTVVSPAWELFVWRGVVAGEALRVCVCLWGGLEAVSISVANSVARLHRTTVIYCKLQGTAVVAGEALSLCVWLSGWDWKPLVSGLPNTLARSHRTVKLYATRHRALSFYPFGPFRPFGHFFIIFLC